MKAFLLLLTLLLASPALAHGVDKSGPVVNSPSVPGANRAARDLTVALLELNGQLAAAEPGEHGRLLAEVIALAKERADELNLLIGIDAAEVLRVAIPSHVRASLPAQAIPFLEREVEEAGELEVFHVDHADTSNDYYLHFLKTAKGKHPLYFRDSAPDAATGTRAHVRGIMLGDAIVVDDGGVTIAKASALANTLGVQKTLTMLVNFSNAPTAQPYTIAQAHSVMFTTTSNYDYENSYQQTSLTGTVAGWFTIAETNATCNYSNIATQAKQAAAAAGYVLSEYSRHVYVFPANACSWWGLGTVGGNPSQAWIHTKHGFTLAVVGHELGHNFGLYHSHSMDCGTASVAASGCTTSDYGDAFDIMGNASTAHFNAFQKERLGWLNAGVSPPLTTVAAQSGTTTYTIAPLEDARDGRSRALKIPRGTACAATSEWLYVESRQAKGFDSYLASNANVLGGVLVRKVTEGNADSSYLLDMTPATSAWGDAALVSGQTFVDPQTGLTIAPLSVGTTGAMVNVTFPPSSCTRAAPKIVLTPAGTVWAPAGSTTYYSATVSNQDSCGCAATAYDVDATVPPGWSATNARTASTSPGAVTSAAIMITTAASATAAFYDVSVKASNSSAPTMTATATSTVAVATALAVTVATDKTSYTLAKQQNKPLTASITTNVSSGGVPVNGATVDVDIRSPSGAVTRLSASTGTAGTAFVSYAMKGRNTSRGTYTVTSRATKGALISSATTSFTVN